MDFKPVSLIPGYEAFTNYEINSAGVLRRTDNSRITKAGHIMSWDDSNATKISFNGKTKKITRDPSVAFLFRDESNVFGKLSDIIGFENEKYDSYLVMNNGDVMPTEGQLRYRCYKWSNTLKETEDEAKAGYLCLSMRHTDKSITFILKHRLLAAMYIQKPDGKDFVDHIDGDPTNNEILNLRWCTRTENNRNIGIRRNNTSGVPNICKTQSGKNPVWHIQFSRRENGKNTIPISEYYQRDPTSDMIPPEILKRRNVLAIEFHGEFARQF